MAIYRRQHPTLSESSNNELLRQEIRRLRLTLDRLGIRSILLGLSGGPDSVLAFHLIRLASADIPGFRLAIAHADFHLRGEESLRDERFVRAIASRYPAVEAHFISFDTESHCRERGISVEMGARELRHDWFDSLRSSYAYDRIATGHNADDNEETLLLNLLRGSGSRGLRGMEPDNGRILRPILHLGRKEILNLLTMIPDLSPDADHAYITDSSNLSDDFRRNFLRHQIIPLLEQRWPGAHTALRSTLHIMQEENRIVEAALSEALKDSETLLSWETIRDFPSPLTLIHRWIQPCGGSPAMAAEMASALPADPAERPRTGGRWRLPDGTEITATDAGLRRQAITIPNDLRPEVRITEIPVTPESRETILSEIKAAYTDRVFLPHPYSSYIWRRTEEGDRMRVGERISKRVSHILKEAGITSAARRDVWMLCRRDNRRPVWIPGIRRGFDDRISGDEELIYEISIV